MNFGQNQGLIRSSAFLVHRASKLILKPRKDKWLHASPHSLPYMTDLQIWVGSAPFSSGWVDQARENLETSRFQADHRIILHVLTVVDHHIRDSITENVNHFRKVLSSATLGTDGSLQMKVGDSLDHKVDEFLFKDWTVRSQSSGDIIGTVDVCRMSHSTLAQISNLLYHAHTLVVPITTGKVSFQGQRF